MNYIRKYWPEFVVLLCLVIGFISITFYFFQFGNNGFSNSTNNWGTFGDYIGGVLGTILSVASVVLIYATYNNQLTISRFQQFESTFFNLLVTQREILNSLSGEFEIGVSAYELDDKKGPDYISGVAYEIYERFDGKHQNLIYKDEEGNVIPNIAETKEENQIIIDNIYLGIFGARDSQLGHYFRHLYHIVKYVHESRIANKKKYIDILQAQMGDDELYVTFYNCIAKYGREKFLDLADKYSLFENIASRKTIFETHCKQFYPHTKFKFINSSE